MVSRSFCGSLFIAHYQLKHKSSKQGQTNHLIESSYIQVMTGHTCNNNIQDMTGHTYNISYV